MDIQDSGEDDRGRSGSRSPPSKRRRQASRLPLDPGPSRLPPVPDFFSSILPFGATSSVSRSASQAGASQVSEGPSTSAAAAGPSQPSRPKPKPKRKRAGGKK